MNLGNENRQFEENYKQHILVIKNYCGARICQYMNLLNENCPEKYQN
jgi:hypothetical protein